MPPTTCAVLEKNRKYRPIQTNIRKWAFDNHIPCYDISNDLEIIQQFVESKDMKLRFLFIDVNVIEDQYTPELVKFLFHGLAWARNMLIFATVNSVDIFNPIIKYSRIKFIISQNGDDIHFYNPEYPEQVLDDMKYFLDEGVT